GAEPVDECHRLAKSMKRLKRTPGQTDVRLNSSTRQLASDPRSQTAEPQNNKCDVAASCPHSILVKRLECCADRLNPPAKADVVSGEPGNCLSRMTRSRNDALEGSFVINLDVVRLCI